MDKVASRNGKILASNDADDAIANVDLIFAMILLLGMITAVMVTMPTLSHENRDWRIGQYMTATRITDNLVSNEKGLEYYGMPKVLDESKIIGLFGTGYIDNKSRLTWWEFPKYTNYSVNASQINASKNVSKILGIGGYNFYIQIYPVGLSDFNSTLVWNSFANVSINTDTVSTVDRYVYIKDDSCKGGFVCYANTTVHYRLSIWMW